jgi:hypothetical protein
MCTVTWWRGEQGAFSILFNRDERRTRPVSELVDRRVGNDGAEFIAPRDPVAGGTWLMANPHGLVVGVLNHYDAETIDAPPARSRGLLPHFMAGSPSVAAVNSVLGEINCHDFAPFILISWDGKSEASWTWNGVSLERAVPQQPLTTSSHLPVEVLPWRREVYARIVTSGSVEELERFQGDTSNADTAYNVRMSRSDARTESFCRVDVGLDRIRFLHRRVPLNEVAPSDARELIIGRS